jgi:putative IMPACT (imprinted ancient) family translation regulator
MPKSNGKPISYFPWIEYNIPYKDGKTIGLALNWAYHNDSTECINILKNLRNKKRINASVRIKYDNTFEFFNFIRNLR